MTTPQQSQQWSPAEPQPDVQHAILAQLVAIHTEAVATRKATSNLWTVVLITLILGGCAAVAAFLNAVTG